MYPAFIGSNTAGMGAIRYVTGWHFAFKPPWDKSVSARWLSVDVIVESRIFQIAAYELILSNYRLHGLLWPQTRFIINLHFEPVVWQASALKTNSSAWLAQITLSNTDRPRQSFELDYHLQEKWNAVQSLNTRSTFSCTESHLLDSDIRP